MSDIAAKPDDTVAPIPPMEIPPPPTGFLGPGPAPPSAPPSAPRPQAKPDLASDPVIRPMLATLGWQMYGACLNQRTLAEDKASQIGMDVARLERFFLGKELDLTLRQVFEFGRDLGGRVNITFVPPRAGA